MAQAVNMKVPLQVRMAAALAGVRAKDFAVGWAAGVMAWKLLKRYGPDAPARPGFPTRSDYQIGSVELAAFDAAITFMRVIEGQ